MTTSREQLTDETGLYPRKSRRRFGVEFQAVKIPSFVAKQYMQSRLKAASKFKSSTKSSLTSHREKSSTAMAQPEKPLTPITSDFTDHVYATKSGVPLWLRIYPVPHFFAPTSNTDTTSGLPWFLWIHGGAYCAGEHYQLRPWLLPLLHPLGIHVVTISYRFTPVVSMEEMVQDCSDAFGWCQSDLPKALGGRGGCEVARYGVGGDSAGGGLSTLLAYRLQSRIPAQVVLNLYGSVDMLNQQRMYDMAPPLAPAAIPLDFDFPESEIMAKLEDRDPSHAVTTTTHAWNLSGIDPYLITQGHDGVAQHLQRHWKVSDSEWPHGEATKMQWAVKNWISQYRLMVVVPLRLARLAPDEKLKRMKTYSASYLIETDEGKAIGHPPTIFMHGSGDTAVPIAQSRDMAEKLGKMGVDVEELYCEGMEHGWDNMYTVSSPGPWPLIGLKG